MIIIINIIFLPNFLILYIVFPLYFDILSLLDKKILKEETKMAYVIDSSCISCGACEPECPVSCITADTDQYIIDEDACIDCGACASVCPVEAISAE
jgi:ferredoxin